MQNEKINENFMIGEKHRESDFRDSLASLKHQIDEMIPDPNHPLIYSA